MRCNGCGATAGLSPNGQVHNQRPGFQKPILRVSAPPREFLLVLFIALFLPSLGQAAEKETWHLLLEPSFMPHEAAWPIPGSNNTVLVPTRVGEDELLPLKRDEVGPLNVTQSEIRESAIAAASKVLEGLDLEYVRDANQVILYAILSSEDPLTSSAVLAPEFRERFRDTLGENLAIAIPNRFRIFVFPRLTLTQRDFSDLVFIEYRRTAYPVSREIFTFQDGKLIAIGAYR